MKNRSIKNYVCLKCGNKQAETDQIRTTGSGFTRFFDIQNRKFLSVSCTRCGFTEFYRQGKTKSAGNVLDFLTN
jgi:predicted nucleic-acid-binding Zn-ribbon protein